MILQTRGLNAESENGKEEHLCRTKRVAILLLILFASIPQAYAISEADVETAIAASSQEAVAGNLLVWFLCAVGFLKISQNIDKGAMITHRALASY